MSSSPSIPPPCPHLQLFLSSSPNPFCSFHLVLCPKPPALGRAELHLDLPHRCPLCPPSSPPRLYFCLSCPLHAPNHLYQSPSSPPHALALDVHRIELFCFACRDQVYDPDFDLASQYLTASIPLPPTPPKRRRLVEFHPWTPTPREQRLPDCCSSPLWCPDTAAAESGRRVRWGLWGLNNLGSTCFMNSVLQALLHTPPLRNYFLNDRHNPYICRPQQRKKAGGEGDDKKVVCLVCDLEAIYSAVFSGSHTPYSPAKFLYR